MKLLKSLAFLFILLSFFGLWQSLSFHINLMLSAEAQRQPSWLFVGGFVVWVPAVLVGRYLARGENRQDEWRAIFRHCPTWMKFFANGLMLYAFTNGVYGFFMMSSAVGTEAWNYWFVRIQSGVTISFYGVAAVIFYAFLQIDR